MPGRFTRPAVLLGLVLGSLAAATGCATMQVHSYQERGASLDTYRTFEWRQTAPRPTGDPRLDANPFFHDRVVDAVEQQLARMGIARGAPTATDLLVQYHARADQRIEAPLGEPGAAGCRDCGPRVYEAGTLMIDLIDTTTQRVVWRGWASGVVDGVVDDQALMERRIDEAVQRIFARLPRRSS